MRRCPSRPRFAHARGNRFDCALGPRAPGNWREAVEGCAYPCIRFRALAVLDAFVLYENIPMLRLARKVGFDRARCLRPIRCT